MLRRARRRPTPDSMPDALAATADRLRRWAADRQLPVAAGYLTEQGALPVVDLMAGRTRAHGPEGDTMSARDADALVAELTAAVAALTPTLAVFDVEVLDARRLEAALAVLADGEAPADVQARARGCRKHVGEVAAIYLAVLTAAPPAVVRWLREAPWYDLMYDADSLVPEREDPVAAARAAERAADERERATWTARKQTETAKRLLALDAFPTARTEKARLVLLREMLGDEAPANDALLREIAREAHAMSELRRAR